MLSLLHKHKRRPLAVSASSDNSTQSLALITAACQIPGLQVSLTNISSWGVLAWIVLPSALATGAAVAGWHIWHAWCVAFVVSAPPARALRETPASLCRRVSGDLPRRHTRWAWAGSDTRSQVSA